MSKSHEVNLYTNSKSQKHYLPISIGEKFFKTALFDTGSDITVAPKSFLNELFLGKPVESVAFKTVTGEELTGEVYNVELGIPTMDLNNIVWKAGIVFADVPAMIFGMKGGIENWNYYGVDCLNNMLTIILKNEDHFKVQ